MSDFVLNQGSGSSGSYGYADSDSEAEDETSKVCTRHTALPGGDDDDDVYGCV